jgi:hypothetical protein
MVFLTPYQFDPLASVCREPDYTEPSMTVPDQSLTVREILERYVRGIAPSCAYDPLYDDREDLDFDDANPAESPDFDLSDIDSHERKLQSLAAELRNSKSKVKADGITKVKTEEKEEQPAFATVPVSETPEA